MDDISRVSVAGSLRSRGRVGPGVLCRDLYDARGSYPDVTRRAHDTGYQHGFEDDGTMPGANVASPSGTAEYAT